MVQSTPCLSQPYKMGGNRGYLRVGSMVARMLASWLARSALSAACAQPYPAAMLSANGKRLGEQDVGLSVVARVEPFAVDGVLQVVHQLEFGVVVLASLLQLCASGIHLQQ